MTIGESLPALTPSNGFCKSEAAGNGEAQTFAGPEKH
jgi:hypothetical protein